jgi:MscS family membrane protein
MLNRLLKLLIAFLFFAVTPLRAESDPESSFSSPYQCLHYFLYYQQDEHYDLSRSALAFGTQDPKLANANLAYQLKAVLDGRGLRLPMEKVSRSPDFMDSLSMASKYIPFPEKLPDFYVEKTGDKWFISRYTQEVIPALYLNTYPYLVRRFKEWIPVEEGRSFLGIKAWQWSGLLVLLSSIGIFYIIFFYAGYLLIHLLSERFIHELREKEKRKKRLARFLSIWLTMGLFLLVFPGLMFSVEVNSTVIDIIHVVRTAIMVMVVLRASDIIFLYARKYAENTPGKLDDQVLPIIEKLVDFIIILAGIFHILQQLDVNITALIAGVSIGGLALALAAQDTVKNIIGSAMIFIDKPFQIGDYIETSQYAGTVEEVGFRSVRLRNVDRSVISVPNGNVANDTIINLGLRPMRRIQLSLGIVYGTPTERISLFVETLRNMIEVHPLTSKNDYLVHFHDLGASSLQIFFRVYIFANTVAEELKIREELVFGIVELAEKIGISFAFPSTSVYIEQDKPSHRQTQGLDSSKQDVALFLEAFAAKVAPPNTEPEDSGA